MNLSKRYTFILQSVCQYNTSSKYNNTIQKHCLLKKGENKNLNKFLHYFCKIMSNTRDYLEKVNFKK